MPHAMTTMLLALSAISAFMAGAQAAVSTPSANKAAFQDEVEVAPVQHMQMEGRPMMTGDFQDSIWHAGRKGLESDNSRNLYAEPFAALTDADIHQALDAAHIKLLALLKDRDEHHDGVLRTVNMLEFLELVLNPDRAPLSPVERALMDHHMAKFIRKQGLHTAQGKGKPVTKELLHTWSTIFFLRDAGAALRARRQQHIDELNAAQETAAKANANVAVHVKKTAPATDFQDELADPLFGLQNVNSQTDAVEFQKRRMEL